MNRAGRGYSVWDDRTNRTKADSCKEVLKNVVGLNTQGTDRTSPNEIVCTYAATQLVTRLHV